MFKRSAIILVLSLALFPVLTQAVEVCKIELPDMGDSSGTLISPAAEKEFGEALFISLHSQFTVNEDAEIVMGSYVKTGPFGIIHLFQSIYAGLISLTLI